MNLLAQILNVKLWAAIICVCTDNTRICMVILLVLFENSPQHPHHKQQQQPKQALFPFFIEKQVKNHIWVFEVFHT
jgi:hypothetical protein